MELILKETSGPLPTSHFELVDDGNSVGRLQLRHTPSKSETFPEGFESHIYYEIYPEYQNRGYGKEILKLGLAEAQKLGLKEVILTCTESNLASQKIIEANAGEMVDMKPESGGEMIRKYIFLL